MREADTALVGGAMEGVIMNAPSMPAPSTAGRLLARFRRAAGLTQAELAKAMGISERSAWAAEHGYRLLEEHELARGERALDLTDEQRDLLWMLVARKEPPPRTLRPADKEASLADIAAGSPFPVILADGAWDALSINQPAEKHWPWLRPGTNLLLHCLTNVQARARICDWEREWAAPLVTQLRIATMRAPRNRRLAELRQAVLDGGDPHGRAIIRKQWNHPDGRLWVRSSVEVIIPAISSDPVTVRISSLAPLGVPDLRMFVMQPQLLVHDAAA